jgi:drug/metabolite transporter (DMT)-like permease
MRRLWSSGFVGAKFGLDYAGTFTILFWRYLLVTAVLALLVTISRQWQPMTRKVIMRHMVVDALAHAGWLAPVLGAIDLGLSAGLAAFITALQPIITGAFSARMTGENVS